LITSICATRATLQSLFFRLSHYKRLDPDTIVPLARQQGEARQIAQRIKERDDLGLQPAARTADGLILTHLQRPIS
jgi:hypothetical protein